MRFSIKDFSSKCDQIRSFLRIWSHLLKKSLMENFIFWLVTCIDKNQRSKLFVRHRKDEIIKSTIFGIFHPWLLLKLFWPIFDMNLRHAEKFWTENRKTQKLCRKREFQYFKFYNLVHSKETSTEIKNQ